MFGIGHQEMLIVMVIILILFGPKNLPKLARAIGSAVRDFKSGLSGVDQEIEDTVNAVKEPVDREAHLEQKATAGSSQAKTASADHAD